MSAAADVVGHFGCMQSQDFVMAKSAIARRCDGMTNRMLDAAFDDGHFFAHPHPAPYLAFRLP